MLQELALELLYMIAKELIGSESPKESAQQLHFACRNASTLGPLSLTCRVLRNAILPILFSHIDYTVSHVSHGLRVEKEEAHRAKRTLMLYSNLTTHPRYEYLLFISILTCSLLRYMIDICK